MDASETDLAVSEMLMALKLILGSGFISKDRVGDDYHSDLARSAIAAGEAAFPNWQCDSLAAKSFALKIKQA